MRLFSKSCHLGFITIVLGGLLAPPLLRADNTCVTAPSGLVSWWRAEGDAKDSADGNNGTLVNGVNFAAGESGTAFNLNGVNQYVLVTTSNLNVGLGSGLTVEGWIKPTTVATHFPIFEYERALGTFSDPDVGAHMHISAGPPGEFYVNLVDTSGGNHIFQVRSRSGGSRRLATHRIVIRQIVRACRNISERSSGASNELRKF